MRPPVVLLSDFGSVDGYAAVMRGVILSYNDSLSVHDACHNIPAQSISSASYVLHTLLPWYPPGTVFVCVVDPGVGSARREVIAHIDGRVVIAPDNGLLTIPAAFATQLTAYRASFAILNELAGAKPAYATTFDGRDLFSPLAARVASDGLASVADDTPTTLTLLDQLQPVPVGDLAPGSAAAGTILHVDTFGNLVTSITMRSTPAPATLRGSATIGDHSFSIASSYSEVSVGEPLAYWGSYGFLEFATRNGSAARTLNAGHGAPVTFKALLDTV